MTLAERVKAPRSMAHRDQGLTVALGIVKDHAALIADLWQRIAELERDTALQTQVNRVSQPLQDSR